MIAVSTQAELAAALEKDATACVELTGDGTFEITEGEPCLHTYGSSAPRVEASGSSAPRVVAYGSSAPRVVAYDSSAPRVEAYGSSKVEGTSGPDAVTLTSIRDKGVIAIDGAQAMPVPAPVTTAEDWLRRRGASIVDGAEFDQALAGKSVAVLFKGVDDEFRSSATYGGFSYAPGTVPRASDWDGGKVECGYGLHFCARPGATLTFGSHDRFVACPVLLEEIAVHADPAYPQKVKAAGCCAPVWEVDIAGERVEQAEEAKAA